MLHDCWYDVNNETNQRINEMKTKDAIAHYGDIKKLAAALNMWPHSIYRWGNKVPLARQYELQIKTNGKLSVSKDDKTT